MDDADPLPRIGEGVVLRRIERADLPAFQSYRNDPQVALYQGWTPMADADAIAFLEHMNAAPMFQPGEWIQLGIAEPDGLGLVGDIGLLLSGDGRHAEIGFSVARAMQGKGVGTSAVRLAIDLVFERTKVERVLGITDARNEPSIRLLHRIGMHLDAIRSILHRGEPCLERVYALPRSGPG